MTYSVTPAICGVGQYTQEPSDPDPMDPLSLMEKVARKALADAGPGAAEACDGVFVVRTMSHGYSSCCGELARRLGVSPVETIYGPTGGTTPQTLIFKAASAIASGRLRAVIVCGAEAAFSERRSLRSGASLGWPPAERPPFDPEPPAFTPYEMQNGVFAPAYAYAFFENAMRAHLGMDHETHRKHLGRLCERLSETASRNPFAWNQEAMTGDEITVPGPGNRMVGFPYTLRMNANIFVDQAAAILLMGDDTARSLGISSDRLVYPLCGASLSNVRNVSQRPALHDAPALSAAARLVFSAARVGLDDVSLFDFYSCFPWAVEAALLELGIGPGDSRPISLTGGLPYFGGPGNNYSLHALAEVAGQVRLDRKNTALVTSLGWYNTRWAVGLYGGFPPKNGWIEPDPLLSQEKIEAASLPEAEEKADGPLAIESLVVLHDKNGLPEHATALGRLAGGRRAFARIEAHETDLSRLEQTELIGKIVHVRFDPANRRNRLIL